MPEKIWPIMTRNLLIIEAFFVCGIDAMSCGVASFLHWLEYHVIDRGQWISGPSKEWPFLRRCGLRTPAKFCFARAEPAENISFLQHIAPKPELPEIDQNHASA